MKRTSAISFGELRRFLGRLGFSAKRAENAWAFHHPDEGLLVFRLYGEDESVDWPDLRSAQKFLDFRGLLEAKDFDSFVQSANTSA